jgi:hypothetical protein
MSWFLIILLVLIMLVFGASCVALIAWIVAGTPNVSASNTLVLNNDPFLPHAALQNTVNNLNNNQNDPTVVSKVMLADNTGGYILATGVKMDETTEGYGNNKESKLVQTLYVDGKPAVVKTTRFSQIKHLESHGPVDIQQDPAQSEVLQWFAHQSNTSQNTNNNDMQQFGDGDNDEQILSTKRLKELLIAEREKTTTDAYTSSSSSSSSSSSKMDAMDERRAQLDLVSNRVQDKHLKNIISNQNQNTMDSNQFGIEVMMDPAPCSKSSTLQLPLAISIPTKFTTSAAALDSLQASRARWQIHEINEENMMNKSLKILWQSEPVSLYDLARNPNLVMVDTGLKCKEVAPLLLRIKLVDCANQHVHASAFFNTAQLVNKSHPTHTYPHHDPQLAWKTFRQFQINSNLV